ncbi:MAG: hypothetical protein AAFZ74_11520, partial [Pseudomonadota bacterium]
MDHTEITREAKIEWLLLERYSAAPSEHFVGTAATEWLTTTTEEQKKFLDELYRLGDDELHAMFIQRKCDSFLDRPYDLPRPELVVRECSWFVVEQNRLRSFPSALCIMCTIAKSLNKHGV